MKRTGAVTNTSQLWKKSYYDFIFRRYDLAFFDLFKMDVKGIDQRYEQSIDVIEEFFLAHNDERTKKQLTFMRQLILDDNRVTKNRGFYKLLEGIIAKLSEDPPAQYALRTKAEGEVFKFLDSHKKIVVSYMVSSKLFYISKSFENYSAASKVLNKRLYAFAQYICAYPSELLAAIRLYKGEL